MESEIITHICKMKGAYLAPFSILLSAFIGAGVALWAVRSHRNIARMKNSMDFINGYSETDDIGKAITEVHKLEEMSKSERSKMATPKGECEEVKHIKIVLNYYESMAVCIHNKIYDDCIIKQTLYTTVTRIFNICQPYIVEVRDQRQKNTFYQELELLVKNWKDNPLEDKTKKVD